MEQNCNLLVSDTDPDTDAARYRKLLGRLLYLTITRPDITYVVNTLCQFMSKHKQIHMVAAESILQYLKITPGQEIFLPSKGDLQLQAFCDADWGGCLITRRSSTGYLILL